MMTPHEPGSGPDTPIVRRAGTRLLHAWHWHTLPQLQAALGCPADGAGIIVADLSLGGWRGHWLAREWNAQLGLPEPPPLQPALAPGDQAAAHYADTVGRLVDNESLGDLNVISAWHAARALVAALARRGIRHVLAVAPLPGVAWGPENLQLLKLLCDAAEGRDFRVGLLLRADAAAPALPGISIELHTEPLPSAKRGGPPCAVPGLLDGTHADSAAETLRLAGGKVLLSPNERPAQAGEGVEPPGLPDWLRVPFALRAARQDLAFLQQQAGLRFAEGAYALAFAILDGIQAGAMTPLEAALVAAQKQNIAIALMDFARAAQGPLPAGDLPDLVQASLYQGKAWGLVMTGRPEAAEPWFTRARVLLDPQRYPRLYLYLLNISALNKLRLGQPAHALALEQEIEGRLLALPRPDWHLHYINSLNLARIHKKLGNLMASRACYARGFAVTHQLRNESDLLYTNLCLAQLDTLEDRHEDALVHWLRSVLHWLSNPVPEALAPRVAQAVLGRPLSNREADVEHVSEALAIALLAACRRLALDPRPLAGCIPLHRIGPGHRAGVLVGCTGWSVALSEIDHGPLPFDGPQYRALNRLLAGLLAQLLPQVDFGGVRAILTDDGGGIELPAGAREMLWSCLKWDIPALRLDRRGARLDGPPGSLAGGFTIEAGHAIDHIETAPPAWRVHFKRYLAPLTLDATEQACLDSLAQPRSLAGLAGLLGIGLDDCLRLVVRMEARRLVAVA